jgi:hypothetical protein
MARHQKLNYETAGAQDALAVGFYDHSLRRRGGTGGCQVSLTFDLYHANPAGAGRGQTLQMTQGRDVKPVGSSYIEDRLTFIAFTNLPVDRNLHQ